MIFVKQNNPGFTALLKLAYDCKEPYEDILRSTNTKEFTLDTSLDKKIETFNKDSSISENNFVLDKTFGS
jgi:hypothetical protein